MQNQFFELTDDQGKTHLINLSNIGSITSDEKGETVLIFTAGGTAVFPLSFENAKTALKNNLVYYRENTHKLGF